MNDQIGTTSPNNPTGRKVASKTIIGAVVGFLIAMIIFLIIMMLGSDTFISSSGAFFPFLLALIAFMGTFIGNAMVIGAYSTFFGERYYSFSKMFGFTLLSTAILFILFLFVYFMGGDRDMTNNVSIFLMLAFHVLFNVYIMYNFVEFLPNPQYSASSLTGTTIGIIITVVIYLLFYNSQKNAGAETQIYYLMLLPTILSYTFIPMFHGIWQSIYYSFYEKGNDFFYLPTTQEIEYMEQLDEETSNEEGDVYVENTD